MNNKVRVFFSVEILTCILLAICFKVDLQVLAEILISPVTLIADILRYLSLSGEIGNFISLILFTLISVSPVISYYIKKDRQSHHYLLFGISLALFISLYYVINPLLVQPLNYFVFVPILYTLLVFYWFMKYLMNLNGLKTKTVLDLYHFMIIALSFTQIFKLFTIDFYQCLVDNHENYFMILNYLFEVVIQLSMIKLLFDTYHLLTINLILKDLFKSSQLIHKIYKLGKFIICFALFTEILMNVLLVLFSSYIPHISFEFNFAFIQIVVVSFILLIVKLIETNDLLMIENDSFV